ncbi:similar to Saccharomyces cerevisiae YOR036W PEP12 Target membrane receptor (t-SNARE) for vesicular intermediates traveling between the Golgi apparatus and the vacuole [Maudiozyma saulgeensis]|uniref:Similar to Saccharomyces cerevisiae YOR036W PEP12 Target membrane receptor (t-SNARE) for vesicular intermediates traveling between the Golgi apparatus and the vacuole n=1 Tax=Maudiozyma saulgeensis TaxID=1789683 RepID=A0A1X7QXW6_9SACH|nr:similar to Saccharomyces cerevisiae YOR036W PEP12 Target membrane receptor (t-SNARE) for vesicular intermediates traveling between the Golgi apparatus and the vacuole [Kazachstania saulgeensis]
MSEIHYTDDTEDPPTRYTDSPEFESLKDKIAKQLFEINGHISTLNQFVTSLNSFLERGNINVKAVDNIDKKSVDKITRVTKLITEIEPSLKELNQIDVATLDRTQVISRDKLTRDVRSTAQQFQITQMSFTEIMKSINNKAKQYLNMDANATAISQEQENEQRGIHLTNQIQVVKPKQSTIVVEMDPINNEEFAYQQNLINQRDEEISNIQQGMSDLNDIFKDLGAVVQQQGIMVDNIEANIYSASNNTNMASRELDKARRYQRRSSKYCLYLLVILSVMLFFLLLIIFI